MTAPGSQRRWGHTAPRAPTARNTAGDTASASRNCEDWHRPRLEVLAEAGADVLALETIPDADEAEALVNIVRSLGVAAWLSYTIDGTQDPSRPAAGRGVRRGGRSAGNRCRGSQLLRARRGAARRSRSQPWPPAQPVIVVSQQRRTAGTPAPQRVERVRRVFVRSLAVRWVVSGRAGGRRVLPRVARPTSPRWRPHLNLGCATAITLSTPRACGTPGRCR